MKLDIIAIGVLALIAGAITACTSGTSVDGAAAPVSPDQDGGAATGRESSTGGRASTGGGTSPGGSAEGGGGAARDASVEGGPPADGGGTADASICHPSLTDGRDTGFDDCSDGSRRRRAVLACPDRAPSTTDTCGNSVSCASDAECTMEANGYCTNVRHIPGYCGCFYGCMKDADCGSGSICECGVVTGVCVPATCTSDASCGPGLACVRTVKASSADVCSLGDPGGGVVYSCQTSADECTGDADCSGSGPTVCRLVGDRRVCGTNFCRV